MSMNKRPSTKRIVALISFFAVLFAAVIIAGLQLQQHAPGNMGKGFIAGGLGALSAFLVMLWRSQARPHRATTFERGFTQTGDERDDAILTRAFAVLGLCALPLTGGATIALALGADVAMVMACLLFGQIAIGAGAFVVISKRI